MAPNRQRGLLRAVDPSLQPIPVIGSAGASRNVVNDGQAAAANAEAEAYGQQAKSLSSLASTIGQYADRAAAVEGEREGRQAGMDTEFRPRRSPGIYSRSYDQAGLQVYESKVRVEIEGDIDRGGDLDKKRDAWLKRTPEELHPDVSHIFERGKLAQSRQAARAEAARIETETTLALQTELETGARKLSQNAYALGLDPSADELLGKDLDLLAASLKRVGPNGSPLVSAGKAAAIMADAKAAVVDARIIGAFDRLKSSTGQAAFLDSLDLDFKAGKGLAAHYDLKGFLRIKSSLEGGLRRKQMEEGQARNVVADELKAMERRAAKGFAPTPDQMAGVRARMKAQDDPETTYRLGILEETAEFQSQARQYRPQELDAYVRDARTKVAANPTDAGMARLDMAEKMLTEMREGLKTDQLGWADRVGLVPIQPLDLSSPEAAVESLRGRAAQAEQVAAYFGIDVEYLRPDDRQRLGVLMAERPEALMGFASTIAESLGDRRAQLVMAEIGKDSPVVAMVGGHITRVGPSAIATDAANGISLMRSEGFKAVAPPPRIAREMAIAVHKGTMNGMPRSEQAAIAMANAAYEVRARRKGLADFNEDEWNAAFAEVLGQRTIKGVTYGGVVAGRQGMISDIGAVIAPPNVRQDSFHDLIRSIEIADFGERPPRYMDGRPVEIGAFRKVTLEQAGSGTYLLNLGDVENPKWLVDEEGKEFVLDLAALEPVLRRRLPENIYLGGE